MKKTAYLALFVLITASTISAGASSVQIFNTGFQGKYLQADTQNNPVAHFRVAADSAGDTLTHISIENYLDSWYVGSAAENESIKENGIKVWYYPVDASEFSPASAQYVTHLPVDGSDWWYNTFSFPVIDGSGIWITADINEYPVGGTCEFQFEDIRFESGAVVNSSGLPAVPPVMMLTQSKPAEQLDISHSGGSMQTYISNSQENIIAGQISFYNNSDSGASPAVISSITLTVKAYSPYGSILSPDSVISSVRIQDKNSGTIYGQAGGAYMPSSAQSFAVPLSLLNVPAGVTITANIVAACTSDESSAGLNFVVSVEDSASVYAYDYYSLARVSVAASPVDPTGFPMDSNFAYIQKRPLSVNISLNDLMPANINKGQLNVLLASYVFSNPGDTHTASAEAYNFTITLQDSAENPVSPASLFSKLSVTDPTGSVIYGLKSGASLETTGNTANFPLTGIITVSAGGSVTVTVRADINPLTTAVGFKAGMAAASDILCRDRNSFSSVASLFSQPLPSFTSLALLTSSCVISHTPKLPAVIYKGSTSVDVMDAAFSAPLSFGGGSLLIRGITLTCRDHSGASLNFNNVFDSLRVSYDTENIVFSTMPSSDKFYMSFASPVTITASSPVFAISAAVREAASAKSVSLRILSESDISRYQDNDPQREIYIAPYPGSSFPFSSGTAFIGGAASGLSLSVYPSPFRFGSPAGISYYLSEPQKVTIEIYDIMGNLIKTIAKDSPRQAGSRTEDSWDGTDSRGRPVNSGTYVTRVFYAGGSMTKKITFIK